VVLVLVGLVAVAISITTIIEAVETSTVVPVVASIPTSLAVEIWDTTIT
jgi:hypothetical protein